MVGLTAASPVRPGNQPHPEVPHRQAVNVPPVMGRRGLTLFEVLLVLALLVILGGLSMPAIDGSFAKARLHHAGDQLRAAWARARLASLQSGQIHAFRCAWGTGQFYVEPLSITGESAAGPGSRPQIESTDQSDKGLVSLAENRLADGVIFLTGQWAGGENAATANSLPDFTAGTWSDPIYFFVDGTASDATVALENERGDRLRVTLRGLTGVSRADDEYQF